MSGPTIPSERSSATAPPVAEHPAGSPAAVGEGRGELAGLGAVVTGGGGGIGAGVAACLARAGAAVIVNDIDGDAARSTAAGISGAGGRAHPVPADVATAAGVDAVFEAARSWAGRVDILVNNVGVSHPAAPLATLAAADLERLCRINLSSQLLCSQAVLPAMVERGWGRIINLGSRTWLGAAGLSLYAATKGGVISLSRSMALELAGSGVTVNVIAPGTIRTPAFDRQPAERIESLLGRSPARRFGTPEDIGRAVCLFASPASAALTGQVLYVCGGRSLYGGPPPLFPGRGGWPAATV